MIEEKGIQTNDEPDFNQFYTIIKGYIEYCILNPKSKMRNVAKREEALKNEDQEYEVQKGNFQRTYDSIYDAIADKGIPYLSVYVEALKKLYEEQSEWRRDIKEVLVGGKTLELFKKAKSTILDLYPILVTVNKTFPVEEYVELSLSPKAAIYGSKWNETKSLRRKPPLKNEEIQAMLEMFLNVKDYKYFKEWFKTILFFVPDQIVDCYKEQYTPLREELKQWVYGQIETNDNYKHTLMKFLIKDKMLNTLIDAFITQPVMEAEKAELKDKIKHLEALNEKEKVDHENASIKQLEINNAQRAEIESLRIIEAKYEKCKMQLDSFVNKYQVQIGINERITIDNERRIKEIEAEYDRMQEQLANTKEQFEAMQITYTALQSDYGLKSNELIRLKETALQKEETARIDIMREFITGINEQLFYLTKFYLELKDTGKLDPEGIGLYADTINNIDEVLAGLGIKKIGVIDEKVSYDTSLYISTDSKIANGEQVVVSGYGWRIGNEVYIKAPVERGE